MTIQAVFFDMGGTIETFGFTRELRLKATLEIQERLRRAGIDLQMDNEQLYEVIFSGLQRYKSWSIETLDEFPPQQVWCEYILPGYSVDAAKLAGIAEDLMLFIETHFYERKMRPEIPAVLEAIKNMGLKIGLISNVNSRGQVPTNLVEYGIRHYFDPIVLSSEYGRRKPDPAIFHYAARLANVPTSACAYVGDRVVRDIDGARRAGFGLAIQIRHDFEHGENDAGATPDAVIENMTGLLDILRAASHQPENVTSIGPIRAILFDAGDILYYRPNRGGNFKSFLRELAIEGDQHHREEKEIFYEQAYRGEVTQDQYREEILRGYGITQAEQVERGKQALEDDDNNVEFFEGVKETLLALKEKGYLLGIVTDTANPLHAKFNWFERGGFGHVWDSVVSSKELGIRKPDPKIYCAALEQLGIDAGQAAFVGHKTSELEGAKTVGMTTIAFNQDPDAEADYFVTTFSDLLKLTIIS